MDTPQRSRSPRRRARPLGGCALLAALLAAVAPAWAGTPRPYFAVALGRAWYPDAGSAGFSFDSPSAQPHASALVGADLGPRWGLELALDYAKTQLIEPDGVTAGDVSLTSVTGGLRLRQPLGAGRLVPWLLIGGGVGRAEFSGREDFTFTGGGSDTVPLGIVAAGADYAFAEGLALELALRHRFAFEPSLRTGGGRRPGFDAGGPALLAGLRVHLDRGGVTPPPSGQRRLYLWLGAGSALIADTGAPAGLGFERWSGPMGAAAIGYDLDAHWSVELATHYARAQLVERGGGDVSGYPLWALTALARYRWPLAGGAYAPWLAAGGGVGCAEAGDEQRPAAVSGFRGPQDCSPVVEAAAGLDWRVTPAVAFGVRAGYVARQQAGFTRNGAAHEFDLGRATFAAGVRIHLH